MKTPHAILAGLTLIAAAVVWQGYTHPALAPFNGYLIKVDGITGHVAACFMQPAGCADITDKWKPQELK